jgi:hypothetical protein
MSGRRAAPIAIGAALVAILAAFPPSLASQLPAAGSAGVRIETLWSASTADAGGFREAPLIPPFDLYETSWRLLLLEAYGLPMPSAIDADRIAGALTDTIRDPTLVRQLPPLEVLRLAVSGLASLGRTPRPDIVGPQLERLRAGKGYRFTFDGPESPAALPAVARVLSQSGVPVPATLRVRVLEGIGATREEGTIQEAADFTLPAWAAADIVLSAAERAPWLGHLERRIGRLWLELEATIAWDGPTLALFAQASEVATANGLLAPSLPQDAWHPLELPSGYLRVAADVPTPDAQTTYIASLVGRTLPASLPAALAASAGPLGWGHESTADPMATAFAVSVLRRLGWETHSSEVRRQTEMWVSQLQGAVTDEQSLHENLRDLCMVNQVAIIVDGKTWMPTIASWAIDLKKWNSDDQEWLARAFFVARVRAPNYVVQALAEGHDRAPRSAADALGLAIVGDLASRPDLSARATDYIETLAAGGLYRASPLASSADLWSTAIGYALAGRSSVDAAKRFATAAGFSMLPDPGPADEAGTLITTFLAVGLARGFDSPAAIP